MSDIKLGDLVEIVVWPCCQKYQGSRYVVDGIGAIGVHPHMTCGACGHDFMWVEADATGEGYNTPLSWLKKIAPPAIPESIEHKETLTA